MTEPRKERCGTCRFWELHERGDITDLVPSGYCRRYPPVIALSNGDVDNESWCQATPETFDNDWCGEWQGECPVKADKCLSIQEVAERIGITTGQAARLVKQMRCVRINRTTVAVTETSLAKWIETNTEEPATE
jgi:hypothetical protein